MLNYFTMSCSICLEKQNNKCVKLSCGHTFHNKCITNWLLKNNTCPLCRNGMYDIDTDEEEEDDDEEIIDYPRFLFHVMESQNRLKKL